MLKKFNFRTFYIIVTLKLNFNALKSDFKIIKTKKII